MFQVCSDSTHALLLKQGQAEQMIEAHRLGVRIISLSDPEYPFLLRQIPNPPPLLYVKGTLPPQQKCIACVGTRWPTTWGMTVTQRITRMFCEHGFSIISGLALGIDFIAHQTALKAGGHTVAVLPCGLDDIYPACHGFLADQILEQGGALITEQPFGSGIHPYMFIQRDRIQSGLSLGVMVTQCTIPGGTMHTARACQKQNRLLCVAAPKGEYALESKSQGNLVLLQEPGTFALQSKADYPRLLALLENATTPSSQKPQCIPSKPQQLALS